MDEGSDPHGVVRWVGEDEVFLDGDVVGALAASFDDAEPDRRNRHGGGQLVPASAMVDQPDGADTADGQMLGFPSELQAEGLAPAVVQLRGAQQDGVVGPGCVPGDGCADQVGVCQCVESVELAAGERLVDGEGPVVADEVFDAYGKRGFQWAVWRRHLIVDQGFAAQGEGPGAVRG